MRGLGVVFLAGALAACGSSPDFCHRFAPVVQKQENEISACGPGGGDSDGGGGVTATDALAVVGKEFPFSIEACEQAITACSANDQTELEHELTCLQMLPAFDCSVLGEASDAGLEDFMTSVGNCEATSLSMGCANEQVTGCGTELHTANTSPNQPLQVGFQTPIPDCLGVGDTHFLEVTVPSNSMKAGGYFELTFGSITANVQGQLNVVLADMSGNVLPMANYSFDSTSTIYLAAAPDSSFLVEVTGDSIQPLGYTVSATFTPINDPYKPDSQMSLVESAPTIFPTLPTNGSYMWAGQRNVDELVVTGPTSDFGDWFSIHFDTGGTVTVNIPTFPFDFAPAADFVDGSGSVVRPASGQSTWTSYGHGINYTVIAASAGTYYLHVYPSEVDMQSYSAYSMNPLQSTAVLPSNFTQPYVLTVSAPQ